MSAVQAFRSMEISTACEALPRTLASLTWYNGTLPRRAVRSRDLPDKQTFESIQTTKPPPVTSPKNPQSGRACMTTHGAVRMPPPG
jgi:hypothetical protein